MQLSTNKTFFSFIKGFSSFKPLHENFLFDKLGELFPKQEIKIERSDIKSLSDHDKEIFNKLDNIETLILTEEKHPSGQKLYELYNNRQLLISSLDPFLRILLSDEIKNQEKQKILELYREQLVQEKNNLISLNDNIELFLQENPNLYLEEIESIIQNAEDDEGIDNLKREKIELEERSFEFMNLWIKEHSKCTKDDLELNITQAEKLIWAKEAFARKTLEDRNFLEDLKQKRNQAIVKLYSIDLILLQKDLNTKDFQDEIKELLKKRMIDMVAVQVETYFLSLGHKLNRGFVVVFTAFLIKIAKELNVFDIEVFSFKTVLQLKERFQDILVFAHKSLFDDPNSHLGFLSLMKDDLQEIEADTKNPAPNFISKISSFLSFGRLLIFPNSNQNTNKSIATTITEKADLIWERDIIYALDSEWQKIESSLEIKMETKFDLVEEEFFYLKSNSLKGLVRYFISEFLDQFYIKIENARNEDPFIYELALSYANKKLESFAELTKDFRFDSSFCDLDLQTKYIMQFLSCTSFKYDSQITTKEIVSYIETYKSIFDFLKKGDTEFEQKDIKLQTQSCNSYLEAKYIEAGQIFGTLESDPVMAKKHWGYRNKVDIFLELLQEDGIKIPNYFNGSELGRVIEAIYHLNKNAILNEQYLPSKLTIAEQKVLRYYKDTINKNPQNPKEFFAFYQDFLNQNPQGNIESEIQNGISFYFTNHLLSRLKNYNPVPPPQEGLQASFCPNPEQQYDVNLHTVSDEQENSFFSKPVSPSPYYYGDDDVTIESSDEIIENIPNKKQAEGYSVFDSTTEIPQENEVVNHNLLQFLSYNQLANLNDEELSYLFLLQDYINVNFEIATYRENEDYSLRRPVSAGVEAGIATLDRLLTIRDMYIKRLLEAPAGTFFHTKEEVEKLQNEKYEGKNFLQKFKQFIKDIKGLFIEDIFDPREFFDNSKNEIEKQGMFINFKERRKQKTIETYISTISNHTGDLSIEDTWDLINELIDVEQKDINSSKGQLKTRLLFLSEKIKNNDPSITIEMKENFYSFLHNLILLSKNAFLSISIQDGSNDFNIKSVINPIEIQETPKITINRQPMVSEPIPEAEVGVNNVQYVDYDRVIITVEKQYIGAIYTIIDFGIYNNSSDDKFLLQLSQMTKMLRSSSYFKDRPEYATTGGMIQTVKTYDIKTVNDKDGPKYGELSDEKLPKNLTDLDLFATKVKAGRINGEVEEGYEILKYTIPSDLSYIYANELRTHLTQLFNPAIAELMQAVPENLKYDYEPFDSSADSIRERYNERLRCINSKQFNFAERLVSQFSDADYKLIEYYIKYHYLMERYYIMSNGGSIISTYKYVRYELTNDVKSLQPNTKVYLWLRAISHGLISSADFYDEDKTKVIVDRSDRIPKDQSRKKMGLYISDCYYRGLFSTLATANNQAGEAFKKFDESVNPKIDITKREYDYTQDIYNINLLYGSLIANTQLGEAVKQSLNQHIDIVKEDVANLLEFVTAVSIDFIISAGTSTTASVFFKSLATILLYEGLEWFEESKIGLHSFLIEEYLKKLRSVNISDATSAQIFAMASENAVKKLSETDKDFASMFEIVCKNLLKTIESYAAPHLMPKTVGGGVSAVVGVATRSLLDWWYQDEIKENEKFALQYAKERALNIATQRQAKLRSVRNAFIQIYEDAKVEFNSKSSNQKNQNFPSINSLEFDQILLHYVATKHNLNPSNLKIKIIDKSFLNNKNNTKTNNNIIITAPAQANVDNDPFLQSEGPINTDIQNNTFISKLDDYIKLNVAESNPEITLNTKSIDRQEVSYIRSKRSQDIDDDFNIVPSVDLETGSASKTIPQNIDVNLSPNFVDYMNFLYSVKSPSLQDFLNVVITLPSGFTVMNLPQYLSSKDVESLKKEVGENYEDTSSYKIIYTYKDAAGKPVKETSYHNSADDMQIRAESSDNSVPSSRLQALIDQNNDFFKPYYISEDSLISDTVMNNVRTLILSKKIHNKNTGAVFQVNCKETYKLGQSGASIIQTDYHFYQNSAIGPEAKNFVNRANAAKVNIEVVRDQKKINFNTKATRNIHQIDGVQHEYTNTKAATDEEIIKIPIMFNGKPYVYYACSKNAVPIAVTHTTPRGSSHSYIDSETQEIFSIIESNKPISSIPILSQNHNTFNIARIRINPNLKDQVILPTIPYVDKNLVQTYPEEVNQILEVVSKINHENPELILPFRTDTNIHLVTNINNGVATKAQITFAEQSGFAGPNKGGDVLEINFEAFKEMAQNVIRIEKLKRQFAELKDGLNGVKTVSFEIINQILAGVEDLQAQFVSLEGIYTNKYTSEIKSRLDMFKNSLNEAKTYLFANKLAHVNGLTDSIVLDIMDFLQSAENILKPITFNLEDNIVQTLSHEPCHRKQNIKDDYFYFDKFPIESSASNRQVGYNIDRTLEFVAIISYGIKIYYNQKRGGIFDMAESLNPINQKTAATGYNTDILQYNEILPRMSEITFFYNRLSDYERKSMVSLIADQLIDNVSMLHTHLTNFRLLFLTNPVSDKAFARANMPDESMMDNFRFISDLHKQLKINVNSISNTADRAAMLLLIDQYEPLFGSITPTQYLMSRPQLIQVYKEDGDIPIYNLYGRFVDGNLIDGFEYTQVPELSNSNLHVSSHKHYGLITTEYIKKHDFDYRFNSKQNIGEQVSMLISSPNSDLITKKLTSAQSRVLTHGTHNKVVIPVEYLNPNARSATNTEAQAEKNPYSSEESAHIPTNEERNGLMQKIKEGMLKPSSAGVVQDSNISPDSKVKIKIRVRKSLAEDEPKNQTKMILGAIIKMPQENEVVIAAVSNLYTTEQNRITEYKKLNDQIEAKAKEVGAPNITNVTSIESGTGLHTSIISFLQKERSNNVKKLSSLEASAFTQHFGYNAFIDLLTHEFPLLFGASWARLISERAYFENHDQAKNLILKLLQLSYNREEGGARVKKINFYHTGTGAIEELIKLTNIDQTSNAFERCLDLYPHVMKIVKTSEFIEPNALSEFKYVMQKDGLALIRSLNTTEAIKNDMTEDLKNEAGNWSYEVLNVHNPSPSTNKAFGNDTEAYKTKTKHERENSIKLKLVRNFYHKYKSQEAGILNKMVNHYALQGNFEIASFFSPYKEEIENLKNGQKIKDGFILGDSSSSGLKKSDIYIPILIDAGYMPIWDGEFFKASNDLPKIMPSFLNQTTIKEISSITPNIAFAYNGIIKPYNFENDQQKTAFEKFLNNMEELFVNTDIKHTVMQECMIQKILYINKQNQYDRTLSLLNLLSPFIESIKKNPQGDMLISFKNLPVFLEHYAKDFGENYLNRYLLLKDPILEGDQDFKDNLKDGSEDSPASTSKADKTAERLKYLHDTVNASKEFISQKHSQVMGVKKPSELYKKSTEILENIKSDISHIKLHQSFLILLSENASSEQQTKAQELNDSYQNLNKTEKEKLKSHTLKSTLHLQRHKHYHINHLLLIAEYITAIEISENTVSIKTHNLPSHLIWAEEYIKDTAIRTLTLINPNDSDSPIDEQSLESMITDVKKENATIQVRRKQIDTPIQNANQKLISGNNPLGLASLSKVQELIKYIAPFVRSVKGQDITLGKYNNKTAHLVLTKLNKILSTTSDVEKSDIINGIYHYMIITASEQTAFEKVQIYLRLVAPYVRSCMRSDKGIKIEYTEDFPQNLQPTQEYIQAVFKDLEKKAHQEVNVQKMLGIGSKDSKREELAIFESYMNIVFDLFARYGVSSCQRKQINLDGISNTNFNTNQTLNGTETQINGIVNKNITSINSLKTKNNQSRE